MMEMPDGSLIRPDEIRRYQPLSSGDWLITYRNGDTEKMPDVYTEVMLKQLKPARRSGAGKTTKAES